MSYEAWGTPPAPEPRYCPVCDQESHSHDCELGRMQARAFLAEKRRDELLDVVEHFINEVPMTSSQYELCRQAIASVKEKS